jgi:hypothetical protein
MSYQSNIINKQPIALHMPLLSVGGVRLSILVFLIAAVKHV